MIKTIRMLLGLQDNAQDELLNHLLASVRQKALSYCNRGDIPEDMQAVVIDMVVDAYARHTDGGIQSIEMGDTSITYRQMAGLMDSYARQLNRFRRIGVVQ